VSNRAFPALGFDPAPGGVVAPAGVGGGMGHLRHRTDRGMSLRIVRHNRDVGPSADSGMF
jgi:hypothetical protein